MTGLLGFARVVDAINEKIGKWVSWLVLAAVIVSAGNAIIRKVFSTSSNAWLELQWYLFGAVFMLGAAWTLRCNEHIRIDIVSSRFAKRGARQARCLRPHRLPAALRPAAHLDELAVLLQFAALRRGFDQCGRPDPLARQGARTARLHPPVLPGAVRAHQARRHPARRPRGGNRDPGPAGRGRTAPRSHRRARRDAASRPLNHETAGERAMTAFSPPISRPSCS